MSTLPNLDPEGLLGPEPFAPELLRALEAEPADAGSLLAEVGPRVFAFPLLRERACARLLAEVDRRHADARAAGATRATPNSMHGYGAVLGELGLGALLQSLREQLVAPLAALHYADVGGTELDGEYGFLAEYGGADADDDLGFHVDDSAVTLNLCLGESFSGSELYFRGLRCDEHRQTGSTPNETIEFEHVVGTAILHAGRHRHGVHSILRGRRRNLILWCQSAAAKEAARSCRPWCGAHG